MSNLHNLDDQVEDDFGFILNGHEYRMRYPTTEETVKAQDIEEDTNKQLDWLYSFIKPVKPDSPPIKDALANVNVKKLQKFTQMVTTELSEA